MPNIQVKFRRGTAAEHDTTNGGFTGVEGEVTVDTTNDTLRVHDGTTAGGVRLAKHSEIPTGGGGTVTQVDTGTGLTGGPITGTGTISIDAGGVDTTQLAADAVTFAKMQNIDDLKVIGNVSGANANPSSVSILDSNTMTGSNSTTLATSGSIKAYVDSQVSAGTVSKWDSGWINQDDQTTPVSVGNAATMVLDHDLGNSALGAVISVYAATDANGTNMEAQYLDFFENTGGTDALGGVSVQSITNTQVNLQLAANGYTVTSAGAYNFRAWGTSTGQYSHIRVVLIG